jgi:hypothetical protein
LDDIFELRSRVHGEHCDGMTAANLSFIYVPVPFLGGYIRRIR